jgi:hypothetical protein
LSQITVTLSSIAATIRSMLCALIAASNSASIARN